MVPAQVPQVAELQADAVERFAATAERRARDYDRTQDISPRQMLVLLDVAERTGYSLGQLLATGEHESAHTWNDFVRPPLGGGRLGSAAGVWQFQPKTFERVVHLYGEELLALTAADPERRRRRLDLGFGPFRDGQVRRVIEETVAGLRGPEDRELQLLRHNFTVLAFAKYLLSKDSGATDPVEDYLFHFLGPAQGRRILTLAQGEARHTRAVKPPMVATSTSQRSGGYAAAQAGSGDALPRRPALLLDLAPRGYRTPNGGVSALPDYRARHGLSGRPGLATSGRTGSIAPAWLAPYGYDHDSPVVSGNVGMFFRDGESRGDPYTWAEFLEHLSRRVRADRQPELVRAKYGVGFPYRGGDMSAWLEALERPGRSIQLRRDDGSRLAIPQAEITVTLTDAETREYQRRLASLLALGQAQPSDWLSDTAALTLFRLGLLQSERHGDEPSDWSITGDDPLAPWRLERGLGADAVVSTEHPAVRDALDRFRKLVGKAPPEQAANQDLVLPAERVALEVYGGRVERLLRRRGAISMGASDG
jgi:hypothetical protein